MYTPDLFLFAHWFEERTNLAPDERVRIHSFSHHPASLHHIQRRLVSIREITKLGLSEETHRRQFPEAARLCPARGRRRNADSALFLTPYELVQLGVSVG
jgi:hypothetical protein